MELYSNNINESKSENQGYLNQEGNWNYFNNCENEKKANEDGRKVKECESSFSNSINNISNATPIDKDIAKKILEKLEFKLIIDLKEIKLNMIKLFMEKIIIKLINYFILMNYIEILNIMK